ncbi:MAG: hypothetical protein ACLPXW_24225 [Xanthobacteraceae bacterium]
MRAAVGDHIEELLRRRRAMLRVAAATRENFAFAPDLGDESAPFVEHFAGRHGHCVEGERLRRLRRLHRVLLRLDRRCGLWLRRRRLRCIGQRRETAGKGRDFIRPRVRLRLGKCAIKQDDGQQGQQHGDAVYNTTEHLDAPDGTDVAPMSARPALDCRGPDYRHRACYRVKAHTPAPQLSRTACKKSYAGTDKFNVR